MKRSRRVITVAVALVGLALLAGALVPAGRALEEQPSFCASCHVMDTAVESWRTTGASRHHPTCIECHSGAGLSGTVQAELQGLHELAAHLTGWYDTPLQAQVPNGYCTKCHNAPDRLRRQHDEVRQFALKSCSSCHTHQMGRAFNPEHRGQHEPFAGTITALTSLLSTLVKLDVNGDRRADYLVRLGPKTELQDPAGAPLAAPDLRVGDRLTVVKFEAKSGYYEAQRVIVTRASGG